MTLAEVTKVLTDLANGTNPTTGQPLPDQSPYHDPQVIRALFLAVQQLGQRPARADKAAAVAERAGQPWTPEEDARLSREFDARTGIPAIARTHGRTRGAIMARLIRLGKLVAGNLASAPSEEVRSGGSDWEKINLQRSQAGKPWTNEENVALLKHLDAGMALEEIAKELRRGTHAVQVRLHKLGKFIETPGEHTESSQR
jgi:hypothetical protein